VESAQTCPGVPSPDLSAQLTLHPATISALFHNSSTTCSYPIGLVNYTGANAVFDYALAAIPPNSTLTLTVNLAACPSRTDAFQFGPGSTSPIILPLQPPSPPYSGGLLVSQTINCATPTATRTSTPTSTPTITITPTGTLTPTVTPTTTSAPTTAHIPGDFNGDGFVDIRDYGMWRQNFGQTNCGNPADADGNCLVDIRDYGLWRLHFGEGYTAGSPTGRLSAGRDRARAARHAGPRATGG
jgi:hypothetical protein